MRASFLIFLVAAAAAAPALADTKAGVDAWERGDYKAALDQWRSAAAKGDADAQFNLGQAYRLGRGVPVDTKKAESFYRQAADQGHDQASDNYGLALFQNGKPRAAIPYLEKSAKRGEPRAQYILGTMLFNGVDIKKDWVRAYALLSRSAKTGLRQANATLTQMNKHIPAEQQRQGLAMADRMTAQPIARQEVAGRRSPDPLPPREQAPLREQAREPAPPPTVVASVTPPPRPTSPTAPSPGTVASGGWRLQLGAFGDPGNAQRLGVQAGSRFPGRSVDYVQAGAMTRVLVGPYATRAAAQAACASVKPCVPVGP